MTFPVLGLLVGCARRLTVVLGYTHGIRGGRFITYFVLTLPMPTCDCQVWSSSLYALFTVTAFSFSIAHLIAAINVKQVLPLDWSQMI